MDRAWAVEKLRVFLGDIDRFILFDNNKDVADGLMTVDPIMSVQRMQLGQDSVTTRLPTTLSQPMTMLPTGRSV